MDISKLTTNDVAALVRDATPAQKDRVRHVRDCGSVPDVFFTYIGCAMPNWYASKWGNRNHLKGKDRQDPTKVKASVRAFTDDLLADADLLAQLPELVDQVLGCWCRDENHPDALCHGLVLVVLADRQASCFRTLDELQSLMSQDQEPTS